MRLAVFKTRGSVNHQSHKKADGAVIIDLLNEYNKCWSFLGLNPKTRFP